MKTQPAADILKLVRPDILEMLGYEPIEPSDLLAERLGIPAEQVVKLDGNENPSGPSPPVIEAPGAIAGSHRSPAAPPRRLPPAPAGYARSRPAQARASAHDSPV